MFFGRYDYLLQAPQLLDRSSNLIDKILLFSFHCGEGIFLDQLSEDPADQKYLQAYFVRSIENMQPPVQFLVSYLDDLIEMKAVLVEHARSFKKRPHRGRIAVEH